MIKLRQLTPISLSVTYAQMIDEQTIRHYHIPYAKILVGPKTADELIIEYLNKEENQPIQIEASIRNAFGVDPISGVKEAADVLQNLSKIKKQLEKVECKAMVHQYNQKSEWYKYLFNPIAIPYNWVIFKINSKWSDHQWKKLAKPEDRFEYLDSLSTIKQLPLLPVAGFYRYATPCRFLTVTFDESNRAKAVEILQTDLRILADKKLIMGHLQKPFTMQLADVVGSGELSYVLGCFLFVYDKRIEKLVGKDRFRVEGFEPLSLNTLLGLRTESVEGALSGVDLRKKYVIEEINICEGEAQERHEAYLKSCEEQQEVIAKNNRILLKHEKKYREAAELQRQKTNEEAHLNPDTSTLISDKKD